MESHRAVNALLIWTTILFHYHIVSGQAPSACARLNTAQVRQVISQSIQKAQAALQAQKTLNEYLLRTGFDEPVNTSPTQPKTYHQHYAAFQHLNSEAAVQVDSGFMVNHATTEMSIALQMSLVELAMCPQVVSIWHELIGAVCMRRQETCDPSEKYRRIDGACNNLANPLWGRSNRPHRRLLPAMYMDGVSMPKQVGVSSEPLPSARHISNVVHKQDPCCPLAERDLSLYVMQWGQMLDHDLTDTAIEKGAEGGNIMCCNISQELLSQRSACFPIPIPANDERFSNPCMNFVRSVAGHDDMCGFGPRNQLNQASSYLDASFLYGHNDEDAREIRAYERGLLRMTEQELFPPGVVDQTQCQTDRPGHYCMKSGDFRIHVMPGLTALQVLFLREHNRIAKILGQLNPKWCDEDIYQETRKIVVGVIQHITYKHWLPYVLGPEFAMKTGLTPKPEGHNTVYDMNTDATISNVFGVAPFRFGHTLLQNTVLFMKDSGMHIQNELAFNRPGMIFSDQAQGCAYVGYGLAIHPASKADGLIVSSVRDNLFLDHNGQSFDLISLNIQRSRDHAVPGYNAWRKYCKLPCAFHFGTGPGGLVDHSPENVKKLRSVYRHPDDIDIFPGGISETPLPGGVIGPLFGCIVGQQFLNLKKGDRFYYENAFPNTGFNEAQLNSVKKMTLGKLLCLHFHLPHIQVDPFRMPHAMNPPTPCGMFPDLDFSLWKA